MTYKYKNKIWDVIYEIDDINEHLYQIYLIGEFGEECDILGLDELPEHDKMTLETMVDEDVNSGLADNYFNETW